MKKLFCLILAVVCLMACAASALATTEADFSTTSSSLMNACGVTNWEQSETRVTDDGLYAYTVSASGMTDITVYLDENGNIVALESSVVFDADDSLASYNIGVELGTSLGMVLTTYRVIACGGINEQFQSTYTCVEADATALIQPVINITGASVPLDESMDITDGTGRVVVTDDGSGSYRLTITLYPNI